ncbi:MAG TPA: hypothetical protein VFV52_09005 [Bacilli bacterium]|nr:hypothetical protein [Bacilli bacterium]
MKKPKRKMRRRDKILILFIVLFGVLGAGFEIWLNTMVDEWDLDKRPGQTEQQEDVMGWWQGAPHVQSNTLG